MKRRTKIIGAGAAAVALAAGGAGIALGTGDDDATDRAIPSDKIGAASAAALEHTGGGQVTGTEVGDEESYYEVEVTRDDGSRVDVQLDRGLNVVSDKADGGGEDD